MSTENRTEPDPIEIHGQHGAGPITITPVDKYVHISLGDGGMYSAFR